MTIEENVVLNTNIDVKKGKDTVPNSKAYTFDTSSTNFSTIDAKSLNISDPLTINTSMYKSEKALILNAEYNTTLATKLIKAHKAESVGNADQKNTLKEMAISNKK